MTTKSRGVFLGKNCVKTDAHAWFIAQVEDLHRAPDACWAPCPSKTSSASVSNVNTPKSLCHVFWWQCSKYIFRAVGQWRIFNRHGFLQIILSQKLSFVGVFDHHTSSYLELGWLAPSLLMLWSSCIQRHSLISHLFVICKLELVTMITLSRVKLVGGEFCWALPQIRNLAFK